MVLACIAPYLIPRMQTIDVAITLVINACRHITYLTRNLDMQPINVCEYITYHKHNNVMTWKRFPNYWSVVRGIYRFPLDYHPKRPAIRACISCLNKILKNNRQFHSPSRSCDVILMYLHTTISPSPSEAQALSYKDAGACQQVLVFQLDHNFRRMWCH